MHHFWILYNGNLVTGPVYVNKHYSEEIKYAGDGRLGYILQGTREVTLVFNEKWQVFHAPELDLSRYHDLLRQRVVNQPTPFEGD